MQRFRWKRLEAHDLGKPVEPNNSLRVTGSAGSLDFLHLIKCTARVVTDSGRTQKGPIVVRVIWLTVWEDTERSDTFDMKITGLVSLHPGLILHRDDRILDGGRLPIEVSPCWTDGAHQGAVDVREETLPTSYS